MHFSTVAYSPRPVQILLSLGVMVLLYSLVGGVFYSLAIICQDASFGAYLQKSWLVVLGFPLVSAVFHAYAARKHEIRVVGVSKPMVAAEWAVRFLAREDMRVHSMLSGCFVLESTKKSNRLLRHWFGSELVYLKYFEDEVIVTGHQRFIDALDTKLRFGKVAFK